MAKTFVLSGFTSRPDGQVTRIVGQWAQDCHNGAARLVVTSRWNRA